jgi:alanyl-tRNA synthetase
MTERLYYEDCFLREFTARVVSCEAVAAADAAAGARFEVVLDRTAFYPTSGGQPNDTGTLGAARVLDVVERADESIVHFTDQALKLGPVSGAIDWERRFDHMQQHTGQHLLSAAFVRMFAMPTVSFHLGRASSTIDLAARAVEARELEEAERVVNEVVQQDLAVEIRFRTAAELDTLGVRKKVERDGPLRVVEIGDFDRQACGGTHVARTGQVGFVQVRKVERQKQNWRVEFVCGVRALATARGDSRTLGEAAQLLSCGMEEVPAMLRKVLEERAAGYRARQRMLERLAGYEAEALRARAPREGGSCVVAQVFDEADAAYLRLLATALVSEAGVCALLATRTGGNVIFAQSAGGPRDMNALLGESLAAAGGKGGGTKDFAQGGVPDTAALEEVLGLALGRLRS